MLVLLWTTQPIDQEVLALFVSSTWTMQINASEALRDTNRQEQTPPKRVIQPLRLSNTPFLKTSPQIRRECIPLIVEFFRLLVLLSEIRQQNSPRRVRTFEITKTRI